MATKEYWYVESDLTTGKDNISENNELYRNEDITIANPDYILVTLISEAGEAEQLMLPINPEGKYVFEKTANIMIREYIQFQPHNGSWFIRSIRPVHLIDENENIVSFMELKDQAHILIKNAGDKNKIYVEFISKDALIYHNYRIISNSLSIGSSEESDISYKNRTLSSEYAKLIFNNGKWKIITHNPEDKCILNKKLVKNAVLSVGDVIEIEGLRCVIGIGFISINDENQRVVINKKNLRIIDSFQDANLFNNVSEKINKQELFNRMPRRRMLLPKKEIKIEAPPMQIHGDSIPLLLRMGGSMVMGTSSMLMGNYTMMLTSVLFPVLTSKYTEKQRKEYEEKRVEKYTQYLNKKKTEINAEKQLEEEVLNFNYPELNKVLEFIEDGRRLWERRRTDDDFLNIRLGYGNIPLLAKYNYPEEQMDLEEDPLEEEMYKLVNNKVEISNVPILTSFVEDFICGILGTGKLAMAFIKRIIMQIIISHSYDEVKTIFLIDKEDVNEIEFIKYIPHCWDDQKSFRFLATTHVEALQISEYLKKELDEDLSKPNSLTLSERLKRRPYYIVFALNKKIFDSVEILKDVMMQDKNIGLSVLTSFDELPKECSKIFKLNSNGEHVVMYLKELDHPEVQFKMDRLDEKAALLCMRQLANTNLKMVTQTYALPKMITFLEMFGVGRIEHLNSLQRWKNHNPVKSLAAPVGVGVDGVLFELDLHEKFHGPHGLIAGMTGSGKSEFIITYILSMAVNYHPDEVAFLLIDYKGGGLAKAFEDKDRGIHLPHLMGTITNLDGAAIQRSLVSIQSENMRRQRIFNETKTLTRESSIDIYDYQALYRAGVVKEPLPHLFIIADEFAELKQQEPEFMDKLISTARIGRSLGVHLILATQKPAGVVNDQIWSNTKFRVCLKVQDRGDSLEMLKRPEAAELKNTGRFYLQVGYNELFAMGQSAWCGAPYYPQDMVDVQKDDEIQFVDSVGQVIVKTKPESKVEKAKYKQIVGIVQYLSELAKKEKIEPHAMWKEPLKKCIGLEELECGEETNITNEIKISVGLVDDPYKQKQYPFVLNLQKVRNCLAVGASGGGKTTFIQTVLYSLVTNFSPEQVNIYVLDFSSRNLNLFRKVPHCGAVLLDEDEGQIEKLISTLEDMIEKRKKLFSKAEIGNYDSYIKIFPLPLIVLVIDNMAAFDEFKNGRDMMERITNLMRNGVSYGVKVLATVTNLNDCIYRMQHEFGTMIALQANDRYAYSNILNTHCRYEPSQTPGRGMCLVDGEALEFQTALIINSADDQKRSKYLHEELHKCMKKYAKNAKALQIETSGEYEDFETFCSSFSDARVPLGYNLGNGEKVAMPLQQLNSVSIYFGNKGGIEFAFEKFLYSIKYAGMDVIIVHRREKSLFDKKHFLSEIDAENNFKHYKCTSEDIDSLNEQLCSLFLERTAIRKEICIENGIGNTLEEWSAPDNIRIWRKPLRKDTKPIFVLFESMLDFELTISPEQIGKFKTNFVMSKGYNIYYGGCFYPEDQRSLKENQDVLKNSMDSLKGEHAIDDVVNEEAPEETRLREIRQAVNMIKESFNTEKFTLLFGGQFDKQELVTLPYDYRKITSPCKANDYNKFLMNYRGNIVQMKFPTGIKEIPVVDEDEMSII